MPWAEQRSNGHMEALAHVYTVLRDLPAWYRRLTPGQLRDIARLMADWKNPPSAVRSADQDRALGIPKLKEVERELIHRAVSLCDGDIIRAANALGMSKTTIYRKLHVWGEHPKLLSQAAALAADASGPNSPVVTQEPNG